MDFDTFVGSLEGVSNEELISKYGYMGPYNTRTDLLLDIYEGGYALFGDRLFYDGEELDINSLMIFIHEYQVGRLFHILQRLKEVNHRLSETCDQITKIIKGYLFKSMRRTPLPEPTDELKHALYHVFYKAMYELGWKGPGNRYPFNTNGYRHDNLKSILMSDVELPGLYAMRFNPVMNFYWFSDNLLRDEIDPKKICYSVYYYLGVIFGEMIEGYDPITA